MLDDGCYSDFSDGGPGDEGSVLLSEDLLLALRAIEKEISHFIRNVAKDGSTAVENGCNQTDS